MASSPSRLPRRGSRGIGFCRWVTELKRMAAQTIFIALVLATLACSSFFALRGAWRLLRLCLRG